MLLRKKTNKAGRILDLKVQFKSFLLINLPISNTESEQLCNIFSTFDDIINKSIVFGRDFNLFFKALGGNPFLKKIRKININKVNVGLM